MVHVSSLWIVLLVGSSFFRATLASQCISNIKDIYGAEKAVTDTAVQRTYVICPNKRYKVGTYDFYSQNLRGGSNSEPPLPLRPNIKIQCGEDGSRSCYIDSGDLQVDGTAIHGLRDNNLDNIEIIGFIFESAIKNSVLATKPGSITFKNCEWTVSSKIVLHRVGGKKCYKIWPPYDLQPTIYIYIAHYFLRSLHSYLLEYQSF